ncbi:MAG TPA: hypothetical protein VFA11_18960 [Acidimicrobiales bacterium]|nr:hypothetical protein [Acidimicrobiales bacterium]
MRRAGRTRITTTVSVLVGVTLLTTGPAMARSALTRPVPVTATLTASATAGVDGLMAGAATADITPPAFSPTEDAAEFVPACGPSEQQIAAVWTGKRLFAFEKPYVDLYGLGRYAPGDPYCDADHSGRYEAPYLAGGSGQNRWPQSADPASPVQAEAVVLSDGNSRVALVVVDSIGLFNVTMDQIRAEVRAKDPAIGSVFVSSTHDESAPDPIGLWGPDTSDLPGNPATPAAVSSGVDEAYMRFLTDRVAGVVVAADHLQPVQLRVAMARQPANTQSCWSSYPYIDDQLMPVLQAANPTTGQVVFTLVNASTHVESLAFSGVKKYTSMLSGDWPARMRAHLEAQWPGSTAVELTGLVGSVETPTVYEPESTQVQNVPGAFHSVAGNPDGCSSVYPQPSGATPVTDAYAFLDAYGKSVADTAVAALSGAQVVPGSTRIRAEHQSLCVQLENNLFAAAFAAGLFPDRPAFADPGCTVGVSTAGRTAAPNGASATTPQPATPAYLRTDVAAVSVGPVSIAYSPGEVFPFTETRGALDNAQMPFPTDCYDPATDDYYCGNPLPMTPWISADMPGSYRLMAGLGEDMIGYLFPPGNFVGTQGETDETPWSTYEESKGGNDRFGNGHADDAESIGPHAGLAVTQALAGLLTKLGGPRPTVTPGLFVDSAQRMSDSPFPSSSFSGAVGVVARGSNGAWQTYLVGQGHTSGWATYDGTTDPGTAGTAYPYSVATAGVMVNGSPLLIDVFTGAHDLGVKGA